MSTYNEYLQMAEDIDAHAAGLTAKATQFIEDILSGQVTTFTPAQVKWLGDLWETYVAI